MSLFQSWIAQEIFALSLVSLEFWWSLTTWDICRWVQNQRGNLRQLSFLTTAAKNATKNSPDLTDKSLKNAFFYVVGTLYQKGQPSFYSLFEKANKAIIYQKHSFPVYYLLREKERHRLVILFDHIGQFWNRTQFRSLIPNLTCLQIVFELHSLECSRIHQKITFRNARFLFLSVRKNEKLVSTFIDDPCPLATMYF